MPQAARIRFDRRRERPRRGPRVGQRASAWTRDTQARIFDPFFTTKRDEGDRARTVGRLRHRLRRHRGDDRGRAARRGRARRFASVPAGARRAAEPAAPGRAGRRRRDRSACWSSTTRRRCSTCWPICSRRWATHVDRARTAGRGHRACARRPASFPKWCSPTWACPRSPAGTIAREARSGVIPERGRRWSPGGACSSIPRARGQRGVDFLPASRSPSRTSRARCAGSAGATGRPRRRGRRLSSRALRRVPRSCASSASRVKSAPVPSPTADPPR